VAVDVGWIVGRGVLLGATVTVARSRGSVLGAGWQAARTKRVRQITKTRAILMPLSKQSIVYFIIYEIAGMF
jgi:hypothetical protein